MGDRADRGALPPTNGFAVTIAEAYARCWEITASQAKNFAYGIRLLPAPKRNAMAALYALARRIDDIGDGDDAPEVKVKKLDEVRADLRTLRTDARAVNHDPIYRALAHASTRYPIPMEAFDELIDGCEQDSVGATYESSDDLVHYCRLVAGTVGRLSLGVFGAKDMAAARPLADDLGVALQLTNILRDVAEDRTMGRIYLPAEDLERFGCHPDATGPRDAMGALIRFECERARGWYERGLQLLPLLDRRSRACTAAMAGIYRRLLSRIEADPAIVLDERVSLPPHEKAWVAARAITVGAP
jgi:phytoene synthase